MANSNTELPPPYPQDNSQVLEGLLRDVLIHPRTNGHTAEATQHYRDLVEMEANIVEVSNSVRRKINMLIEHTGKESKQIKMLFWLVCFYLVVSLLTLYLLIEHLYKHPSQ